MDVRHGHAERRSRLDVRGAVSQNVQSDGEELIHGDDGTSLVAPQTRADARRDRGKQFVEHVSGQAKVVAKGDVSAVHPQASRRRLTIPKNDVEQR